MKFKPIIYTAIAFGLLSLSHSLELRRDLAPFMKDGGSGERLSYHLMALVALVGAIGLFIAAGMSLIRAIRY